MDTVAVTGASGHLGANLVRQLLVEGYKVRCLVHNDRRAIEGLPVESVPGDVMDPETLRVLARGARWMFHLAAVVTLRHTDPTGRVREINVQGTRNVINACRESGVERLVHFGTVHIFDERKVSGTLNENAPMALAPGLPVYDRTKALAVREVMDATDSGLDAVVICPTAVIGPFDFKPSAMGRMILKMARGRLPVALRGGFDWVDARDVARAAVQAARQGISGRSYLLGGRWASIREVAGLVAQSSGARPPVFYPPVGLAMLGVPFVAAWSAFHPDREPVFTRMSLRTLEQGRRISHELAGKELGFRPRPLKGTIKDTVEWLSGYHRS